MDVYVTDIFDYLIEFFSDLYGLVSKYQIIITLMVLVAFYWIFIRKITVVKKEDYKIALPVKIDEPYVCEEILPIPPIPSLSGWFKTKLIRLMSNTYFKSYLDTNLVKILHMEFNKRIIYPEEPTFFPLVEADSNLFHKESLQEKDLWNLIKEKSDNTDEGFEFVSISDLILLYKEGKKTPEIVMKTLIKCIKTSEAQTPPLKGFIEYYEDKIMEQAVASTKRWKEGRPISVLDGVPIGVKDHIIVGYHHCRKGLPADLYNKKHDISEERGLVKKLRRGGAILIGMTNMHQCGIGITGINPSKHHGTPRNPYNVDFTTGGSSSGSANTVASGLAVVSLGTDGGGSIRIPAACCGIVGLKATYGSLSTAGGLPSASTVAHTGTLCSTVRDTAIMFGYLAGNHDNYLISAIQPPVFLGEFDNLDVSGLKVGVDRVWMNEALPEIKSGCENALKWLKEIYNVEVVDIHVPEKLGVQMSHAMIIISGMLNDNQILKDIYADEINVDTLSTLEHGKNVTAHDYLQHAKQRTRSINALKYLFTQVDIIFTPAFARFQPELTPSREKYGFSDIGLTQLIMQTHVLGNLSGVPAITLPVAYSDDNLPIAVQLISSWWREDNLLKMAYALEHCVKRRAPQVYFDIRE